MTTPYATRAVRFVKAGDPLTCPAGHRLRDPLVWHLGGFRCSHHGRGGAECGKLCLYLGGALHAHDGTTLVLLVEVTAGELQHMKRERLTWEQSAAYLGLFNTEWAA